MSLQVICQLEICQVLVNFLRLFYPKYLSAVAMATGICRDERSVDCLVLCHNKQNRKVSAKSVTMRGTALC